MPESSRQIPVDLDHLNTQTAGDRELARQVLDLFRQQIPGDIAVLRQARQAAGTPHSEDSAAAVKVHAHRIVGASRAVGAHAVAEAALAIEHTRTVDDGELEALERAFALAKAFIADYLAEQDKT